MNTVTISGVVEADPVLDRCRGLDACEFHLAVDWTGVEGRISTVAVWCVGRIAATAAGRLAADAQPRTDRVVYLLPLVTGGSDGPRRLHVVAERFESIAPRRPRGRSAGIIGGVCARRRPGDWRRVLTCALRPVSRIRPVGPLASESPP